MAGKHSEHGDPKNQLGRDCGVPIPASKPKIWSLADTVACKTPPPACMGQVQGQVLSMQQQQQQLAAQRHLHSQSQPESLAMHQQQQLQEQQQQPLPMGSHIFNGAPYVRAHTTAYGGFLGATTQQLHTTATNSGPYSSSSSSVQSVANPLGHSSTSSSNGTHTPTTHTTANPSSPNEAMRLAMGLGLSPQQAVQGQAQAQAQSQFPVIRHQQQQSQSIANQRAMAMGFPEAQPDTPPQTPPNMKVLSGALSLLPTASQIPMTATCRSSNAYANSTTSAACNYPVNFSTRLGEYEYPANVQRDDYSSSSSSSSSPPHLQRNENIFKTVFKR